MFDYFPNRWMGHDGVIDMKRFLLAGVVSLAFAGAAAAADLPAKAPEFKAPPAPVWNWTGFYVGGYYATSIAQSRGTSVIHPQDVNINDGGISVGATAGYNWQFNPNWLVGLEGDFGWLGTSQNFLDYNDTVNLAAGVKTDWYGTARARFGYVTGPSLIYATGGAAFARVEETFGLPTAPTANTFTRWGWTAGGGIETKLSRSWTTKTEYLYVDIGSNSFASNAGGNADMATVSNHAHVLKTGFNYKLGEGPFEMFPFFGAPLSSPQRWTGFYAGVNAGGAISQVQVPTINQPGPLGAENINGTGVAGGGQAGYNWLLFSNWIIGAEADIGYMGINHSYADWFDPATTFGVKTDWYSTVRGRIGTTTGPAFLYATGGAAFAHVSDTFNIVGASTVPTVSVTRSGWTLGGGTEVALDSRWSARLEYLYMNLGTTSLDDPAGPAHVEFKNRFQVVRAGVSYKFGEPDVVTARY